MPPSSFVIDDLSCDPPLASIGTRWQLLTDRVMGGVSVGTLARETVEGRPALRMRGDVSLANNGGFVQMALDLAQDGASLDAGAWLGLELTVIGNDQQYGVHLRTSDLARPWQSYRSSFLATPVWRTIQLPFADFTPHRTDIPLDLRRLRRLGVIAIGREFSANIAIGGVRLYG
jgi:hypothetical protein